MNLLDLGILLFVGFAAFGGYRLGFLARAASWVGLGLGLFVAAKFLPSALRTFGGNDPSSKLLVAAIVLVGGAFVGQALGLLLGSSMGRFLPIGPLRTFDRVAGALAGALGVVLSVWLFVLPSISDLPGRPSREARNSSIARFIDETLPPPPNTLQALRRLVGESQFPRVFESLRPAPVTGPPPASSGLTAALAARISASTVKVSGVACQRIQEGSGFTVDNDLVVTNAHVVAGERSTEVLEPNGRRLKATVVLFDSNRDLAFLRVPNLNQVPLAVALTPAKPGVTGAVFGHPGGQDQLVIAPAAIRQRVDAIGRDLYDTHQTTRDVFIVASDLHPGDSGGALVDTSGTVVGVAFAIAPDRPGTAYALTSKELRADLAAPHDTLASTGPCLRD